MRLCVYKGVEAGLTVESVEQPTPECFGRAGMVEDEFEVFERVDIDQLFELGPGPVQGRDALAGSLESLGA